MDKFVTLCFDCRTLMKDHYRVDVYDSDVIPETRENRAGKKKPSCENCGKHFDLAVCRLRTLPPGERGKL